MTIHGAFGHTTSDGPGDTLPGTAEADPPASTQTAEVLSTDGPPSSLPTPTLEEAEDFNYVPWNFSQLTEAELWQASAFFEDWLGYDRQEWLDFWITLRHSQGTSSTLHPASDGADGSTTDAPPDPLPSTTSTDSSPPLPSSAASGNATTQDGSSLPQASASASGDRPRTLPHNQRIFRTEWGEDQLIQRATVFWCREGCTSDGFFIPEIYGAAVGHSFAVVDPSLDAFLTAKGWSPDAEEIPVIRMLWVQAHKVCVTLRKHIPLKFLMTPTSRVHAYFPLLTLKGKSDWKFIPWKHRLSKLQEEDYHSARPKKMAKFESFTDVLYDDVPSRNIGENMGLYGISNLLSIHSNAIALADIAHLATLRAYERKFLKHVQARTDPTLRPPNAQECEAADRRCWEVVGQLRQEGWSVDDALHEFTDVRAELVALLAPRLAPFKGKKGDGKGGKEPWKGQPHKGGKATGGKGGAGAGKGRSNFTKGTHAFEWASKAKINGEQKVLCMAYSTHKGCTSANCKFEHLCPVILENGKICLQKHPAYQHAQKAGS
ncbi:unnamed protein product [Symbiodinium sp. CCMP2592]|nr:unnamed protein product [Symbiodinium sp. CCMP2592]